MILNILDWFIRIFYATLFGVSAIVFVTAPWFRIWANEKRWLRIGFHSALLIATAVFAGLFLILPTRFARP